MMPRVLVVDDDTLYAEAATAILAQEGSLDVVGRAADGREAVELALALRPDVVLMDINMPVMDGLEATRSLRRLLPSARVVVVTSSQSEADRRSAHGAGAHAFLTKDLGSGALVEAALSAGLEAAQR
jgi:DNA-binding NarL/FixJ family response regulator